jgi:hypothetical protein
MLAWWWAEAESSIVRVECGVMRAARVSQQSCEARRGLFIEDEGAHWCGRREKAQTWLARWWGQSESRWLGTKSVRCYDVASARYLTFDPAEWIDAVPSWRFPAARNAHLFVSAASASGCVRQSRKRALDSATNDSGPTACKISRITCC